MSSNIEINKVHHMDNRDGIALLPDKCANLIICDPPYFEVKGAFDFVFKDFSDYLAFMEQQAIMYKRILADNGSLFIYGHAKKIAYVQVIFDKYFALENNIAWEVIDRQTHKGVEGYRCFAPVTERILFYSNELVSINGAYVYPVRDYLRDEIMRVRGSISYMEINTVFGSATNGGGMANAILSLQKQEPAMIAEDQYNRLRDHLNLFLTGSLSEDYGALRMKYEDLRRPFNNLYRLTDVMRFSQEAHITGKYDHDTVKPEGLTRALIQTCSRPGDLVVIPFVGSGTECSMSIREKRNFIGFEIKEEHAIEAQERCGLEGQVQTLF